MEATLDRDEGIEGFEYQMRSVVEGKDALGYKLADPAVKTKRDIKRIVDQYGEELKGKMTRVSEKYHALVETNNGLVEKEIEWNSVMEYVNARDMGDVKIRYDEIMTALIDRNAFVAQLRKHWNVEDENELFQMPMNMPEIGLMRRRMESAETKLRDATAEATNTIRILKERISGMEIREEAENKDDTLQFSNQLFSLEKRTQKSERELQKNHSKNIMEGLNKDSSDKNSIGKSNSGTSISDDESDTVSDSKSSSSSSESEKKGRKRKKKKKKEDRVGKGNSYETSKEKRKRERNRRRLIDKLPLPDKYNGNKEGWATFSEGFRTRYAEEDDTLVRMILKETLRGEAQKEYRSIPKDIEKEGWRKCMKWLKERLFGGTRYTKVDYDRKLRKQILGNRRVADVCEEFTHWIDKIYEGESSKLDEVREEAKKRQLIVLFERTDQYRELLKMIDQNIPYEEMRQHLERNEYAKKIEGSCHNCGMNNHRTIECRRGRDYSTRRCLKCNKMGHISSMCNELAPQMMRNQRNPVQSTGHHQINEQPSIARDGSGNRGGYNRGSSYNGGYNRGSPSNGGYDRGGSSTRRSRGEGSNQKQWPRNGSNNGPPNQNGTVNQSPRANVIMVEEIDDNEGGQVMDENCEKSLFVKLIIPESCTIGGVERKVILDTGSEISLIDMETWQAMGDVPIQRKMIRGITGAQGKEIPVMGTCVAHTKMRNGKMAKVGYHVSTTNIPNPLIGGPALEALGYKLMTMDSESVAENQNNEVEHVSPTSNAVALRRTEIEPGEFALVLATGMGDSNAKMLEACRDDVIEGIVEGERTIRIPIWNGTGETKVINKHESLGAWKSIEYDAMNKHTKKGSDKKVNNVFMKKEGSDYTSWDMDKATNTLPTSSSLYPTTGCQCIQAIAHDWAPKIKGPLGSMRVESLTDLARVLQIYGEKNSVSLKPAEAVRRLAQCKAEDVSDTVWEETYSMLCPCRMAEIQNVC
ncbi:hypothetical protein PRIPAC_94938 [Pristionchus pacificus]|uniref:Peptidase A2 domain-containing protein n=1 Tax=Pristionchus pacificus TaxID=54126 RepID=A0A2A6BR32_PRIPA|nr:hypothetical protein PRIPAC_94938 [Pristionchus pacificus]|eukprot:PDM68355.1 hypothetical protein PRIPAC_46399 [Pristionchus pacificus]